MSDSVLPPLTLTRLRAAVAGKSAGIRVRTTLVPCGEDGDKVFPPTYKHPDKDQGLYACEDRRIDGRVVPTVLLDSVASQANRLEEALLRAFDRGECAIPLLSVEVPRPHRAPTRVTALDAPHRFTDAIFRDSTLDSKPFRESAVGKRLVEARPDNATAVFEFCPTALLFGYWDSQAESGGRGARVARCLVSEIIGLDVVRGQRTSSRIDPLAIGANAARVFRSKKDFWTLEPGEAVQEKKGGQEKPVLIGKAGKAGKPSAINHGNVTPSVSGEEEPGGVTISGAIQTTVLNLPQLRRLRFPKPGANASPEERDGAAWTALAALALYAICLNQEEGYALRSRCHLLPKEAPCFQLVGETAQHVEPFGLDKKQAKALFEEACQKAREAGLPWKGGTIPLQPSAKLVELVRRSDEKAEEGEEDASA